MLAGTLTVPATYVLARRVYGSGPGWAAAILVTLSPFAILFAPTAFTDGWLALFVTLAVAAAVGSGPAGRVCSSASRPRASSRASSSPRWSLRWSWLSGAPRRHPERSDRRERSRRTASLGHTRGRGRAVLGFLAVFGPVTWWDSLRWHNRPSYWDQSLQTYGGIVLLPASEWSRPRGAVGRAGRAAIWSSLAQRPRAGGRSRDLRRRPEQGREGRILRLHAPFVAPLRMPNLGDTRDSSVAPLRILSATPVTLRSPARCSPGDPRALRSLRSGCLSATPVTLRSLRSGRSISRHP